MDFKIKITIYEDLFNSDVETLMRKGLDSDQNIFEALVKNMFL